MWDLNSFTDPFTKIIYSLKPICFVSVVFFRLQTFQVSVSCKNLNEKNYINNTQNDTLPSIWNVLVPAKIKFFKNNHILRWWWQARTEVKPGGLMILRSTLIDRCKGGLSFTGKYIIYIYYMYGAIYELYVFNTDYKNT